MNTPIDELLTPEETARLLGVDPATLANWRCTQRVRLDYVKLSGRLVRYSRRAVEAFIEARTIKQGAA